MVSLSDLWIPILVSAVAVFVASSIIHMVLPYHRSDYKPIPKEEAFLDAVRQFDIPPGDYLAPRPASRADMSDPRFIERVKRGPWTMMTIMPGGSMGMGKQLVQWFLYCLLVSILSAELGHEALARNAGVEEVCFFVGTAAFMGYALALLQSSIWYRRNWLTTLKAVFDGFIYALITGQTFGWIWPR